MWTWSIKDYIKTLASTLGITPQAVEAHVNQDPALPLCADIANMLKHGVLENSRSGRWPVSVTPSYSITHDRSAPASPIREISVSATAIRIDIANPALVEVQFKVKARDGSLLPDGLAVVADAISSWEGLLLRLGTKVTV